MTLSFEANLTDGDRLEALQRLDQFRRWHSLDDKRYCLCCSKIISGWQVRIVSGSSDSGPLRLVCPTQSCESIPMDWVLPTDEVLAKMSILPNDAELAQRPAMEEPGLEKSAQDPMAQYCWKSEARGRPKARIASWHRSFTYNLNGAWPDCAQFPAAQDFSNHD